MGKTSKNTNRGVDIVHNKSSRIIQNNESDKSRTAVDDDDDDGAVVKSTEQKELLADHLPPLMLVCIVLICSGILWVFAMRDTFSTGRNIAGSHDEAMLQFTKSTTFFNDSKGWKSTQGGLSSIKQVTTDANNMGGLFVRKVGGAAAMAVQTQKLMPLLFHPLDARWMLGHFRPLLWIACVSNVALATFYASYMNDFVDAGAERLPLVFIGILSVETIAMAYFLFVSRKVKRGPSVAMQGGKTPKSIPSRIVARTVLIVSTAVAIIAARDFFFPGQILGFIPRDDIYLEWTGAFLHSPPQGTPEADEYEISSSFHVGEKFLSQFLALNLLILCIYKFATAIGIRFGSDGGGMIKCRMIWKAQALGNALLLFLFRLFAPAANTASLDLRWHLMCVAYECFILGLYGYF